MIVAGLVGVVLTFAVLRNADDRIRVAVAARDLQAGTVVREADVRYERVRMDDDLLRTVLEPDDVEHLNGLVAADRIEAGELIARSDLRSRAARAGLRAVSIPIEPARAVDGDLAPGDRVDVILVTDEEVSVVVAATEVLAVSDPRQQTGFGKVEEQFTLTLAVDTRGAQALATAITDGDVLVARSTGSTPAREGVSVPIESVTSGGAG